MIFHELRTFTAVLLLIVNFHCKTSTNYSSYHIPSEFEKQEYIWLSWVDRGFLGGEPFKTTIIAAIKEIHPYVKVKIFYGPQGNLDSAQLQEKIYETLAAEQIDTSRISLFYNEKSYGAIQDPGPIFLRNESGTLAVADFKFQHPDKRAEAIDRNVSKAMNIPSISSDLISEGGAWQTNGAGTMLLVESVELDRNKSISKEKIEQEYKHMLGVKKIIWLKNGLKEEEWGKLNNGIYGIGTGGHIDEFCRFVDEQTVLLAEVPPGDTIGDPIAKESYNRMEESFVTLKSATTADNKPINIIRLPVGPIMTKKVQYNSLSPEEKYWFENVRTDSVEFYLATGYMNFIIANEVVVTARFWKEGLPISLKERDAKACHILEKAFPKRKIVQIDCMPLHHDGAGLHCHSRNQAGGR